MYTFDFDSYGEIKGLGRDADGESSIKGYWSGEGNVMFWMEKAGRIMTFCSGVYERSLEVGMRAGGRWMTTGRERFISRICTLFTACYTSSVSLF